MTNRFIMTWYIYIYIKILKRKKIINNKYTYDKIKKNIFFFN